MAGDWIKMTKDLPDKPEVWRMAGVLGIDADSVVGKLLRVWAWFDSHTEDGNAVGVTYPLLDRIAGVNGFAEAMAISGWLEQNGHTMYLPNFDRHNGKTAKNRALTNERVAKSRTKQQESNAGSNGESATKTVTREEKRREDKYSVPNGTGADAPKSPEQMTKDELWSAGKSLLMAADMPKAQCGSFVGKLVKDYTDAVVIEAVRAAVVARPADPAQYLKAACQRMAGQRIAPNKQEAIEARNRAVAAEWLASEGVICN